MLGSDDRGYESDGYFSQFGHCTDYRDRLDTMLLLLLLSLLALADNHCPHPAGSITLIIVLLLETGDSPILWKGTGVGNCLER